MSSEVSTEERDRILRPHFTEWAKEFKVYPSGTGFVDENGNAAYPAHAVCEPDGRVWLSTLKGFDESGIRGHIEENGFFQTMLIQAATLPDNPVGGLNLEINGTPFRIIIQNTKPGQGKPIINVLFITDPKQTAA